MRGWGEVEMYIMT